MKIRNDDLVKSVVLSREICRCAEKLSEKISSDVHSDVKELLGQNDDIKKLRSLLDNMLIYNRTQCRQGYYVMKQSYDVVVDNTVSLKELIRIGCYDRESSRDINFMIIKDSKKQCKSNYRTKIELLGFTCGYDEEFEIKEIREIISKIGYRPADLRELLSLGAQHKEIQKDYDIISLGSKVKSTQGKEMYYPGLSHDTITDDRYATVRTFALKNSQNKMNVAHYRFAIVKR